VCEIEIKSLSKRGLETCTRYIALPPHHTTLHYTSPDTVLYNTTQHYTTLHSPDRTPRHCTDPLHMGWATSRVCLRTRVDLIMPQAHLSVCVEVCLSLCGCLYEHECVCGIKQG
jgi:hypothetical protein